MFIVRGGRGDCYPRCTRCTCSHMNLRRHLTYDGFTSLKDDEYFQAPTHSLQACVPARRVYIKPHLAPSAHSIVLGRSTSPILFSHPNRIESHRHCHSSGCTYGKTLIVCVAGGGLPRFREIFIYFDVCDPRTAEPATSTRSKFEV